MDVITEQIQKKIQTLDDRSPDIILDCIAKPKDQEKHFRYISTDDFSPINDIVDFIQKKHGSVNLTTTIEIKREHNSTWLADFDAKLEKLHEMFGLTAYNPTGDRHNDYENHAIYSMLTVSIEGIAVNVKVYVNDKFTDVQCVTSLRMKNQTDLASAENDLQYHNTIVSQVMDFIEQSNTTDVVREAVADAVKHNEASKEDGEFAQLNQLLRGAEFFCFGRMFSCPDEMLDQMAHTIGDEFIRQQDPTAKKVREDQLHDLIARYESKREKLVYTQRERELSVDEAKKIHAYDRLIKICEAAKNVEDIVTFLKIEKLYRERLDGRRDITELPGIYFEQPGYESELKIMNESQGHIERAYSVIEDTAHIPSEQIELTLRFFQDLLTDNNGYFYKQIAGIYRNIHNWWMARNEYFFTDKESENPVFVRRLRYFLNMKDTMKQLRGELLVRKVDLAIS